MKVTTKTGDIGVSCLPTIKDGKVSKGALAFDVLGMIDRMDHCIQVCCVELIENSKVVRLLGFDLNDYLVQFVLNRVRGLYGVLLSDHTYSEEEAKKWNWDTADQMLDNWAESHIEPVYKDLSGREMEADLAFRCFSRLGLAFNAARLQARDLERLLVNQLGQELALGNDKSYQQNLRNHKLVLPFLNRLSDFFYECTLLVEAAVEADQ